MTTINTQYKADTVSNPTSGTTDPNVADATARQALLDKLQKAIQEMEEFKSKYYEYLDMENIVKFERIELTAKALSAEIASGQLSSGSGTDATAQDENNVTLPTDLTYGWHGLPDDRSYIDPSDQHGQDIVDKMKDHDAANDEFMGTMSIPNSSGATADGLTGIVFQLRDDPVHGEVKSAKMYSKGKDAVLVVEFADGHRQIWVIKNGTVRPDPIAISAVGLQHGVTIDCSGLYRISDGSYQGYPFGSVSGVTIHGGEGKDKIYGSQGNDIIVGWAGDDEIWGNGGDDAIYGDEYQKDGSQNMAYGGDDKIHGGPGIDTIYAGGGAQDTVYKSDENDSIYQAENLLDDTATNIPPASGPGGWLDSNEWTSQPDQEDGMVVVSHDDSATDAGTIEFNLPPGYSSVFAEPDADGNLILTVVGEQGFFRIKIEDFFSESRGDGVHPASMITHLKINGNDEDNIIDFSRISVTGKQLVTLNGGKGDDMIIGCKRNELITDGVDLDNPLRSHGSGSGNLNKDVQEGVFADSANKDDLDDDISTSQGYKADAKQSDGYIEISEDTGPNAETKKGSISIKAPAGYDKAYIVEDPVTHDFYIILVKPGTNGHKADTIVIKIDAACFDPTGNDKTKLHGMESIGIMHMTKGKNGGMVNDGYVNIVPLDYTDLTSGYWVDGNEGSDTIFVQKGTRTNKSDPNDDIIEGTIVDDTINQTATGNPQTGQTGDTGNTGGTTDPTTEDPTKVDMSDSDYKKWAEANKQSEIDACTGTTEDEKYTEWLKTHANPHGKSST